MLLQNSGTVGSVSGTVSSKGLMHFLNSSSNKNGTVTKQKYDRHGWEFFIAFCASFRCLSYVALFVSYLLTYFLDGNNKCLIY